jgi:sulfate adenylyltransferase
MQVNIKWQEILMKEISTPKLVPPHGGELLPLLISDQEKYAIKDQVKSLHSIRLNSREASDLIMLGMGAYSPLKGFMGSEDYKSVILDMHLADSCLWPMPVTLSINRDESDRIKEGQRIALFDSNNVDLLGTMIVEEKFTYDKLFEAKQVFGTSEEQHPGVSKIYGQGEIYLAGPVQVLSEGGYPERFPEYSRPAETREIFRNKGWKTIAAFQTRNPMHRSHEYLTKIALEVCDGLFIHPVVGRLKEGDIPAEIRMKCYKQLLDHYYPRDRVVLRVYPIEMRYGGPREAILHAIIRQNFGCSHIIIGRDHAGVGKYYGPFDAQQIFDQLKPGELQIQPLKLDTTFWCHKCDSVASFKTCPHEEKEHLSISGTELRQILTQGERPSDKLIRREVSDILISYYHNGDI